MPLTRATYALLKPNLSVWAVAAKRHRAAAARIQHWWQRLPKPTNNTDPITLEIVPRGSGKKTEEGGGWFDLYVDTTILYRYAADSLFAYLVSQRGAVEPHIRHKLNKVELARLNTATSTEVKRSLRYNDATRLLLPETENSRCAQLEQDGLLFFLEDDFLTLCDQLTESCQQYARVGGFCVPVLTDFVNVFADICHMDMSRAEYHLEHSVQGIRKTIFQLLPTLKTDVFCDILLTLDRPSQIYNLHRIMQQYANGHSLELRNVELLIESTPVSDDVSCPVGTSPQSPSFPRAVPLTTRIAYGSVDDEIDVDDCSEAFGALLFEVSSTPTETSSGASLIMASSPLFIQ